MEVNLVTVEEFMQKHPEMCVKYDIESDVPQSIREAFHKIDTCHCHNAKPLLVYVKDEKEVFFFGMCKNCNSLLLKEIIEDMIFSNEVE